MELSNESRRAMLTPGHWGLNEEQSAAFLDDQNTVVIACPGSGKTRLSIAKAVKYILTLGVDSVVMVTFSRAAADQMRSRLADRIGLQRAAKVKIGTYHGLCHELLRAYYKANGQSYRVVKEGQSRKFMFGARDKVASNITNDEVLEGIARIKATYLTDEEVAARTDPVALIFAEYQNTLAAFKGKDFGDLVREATRLMLQGKMRPFGCKHLLADEFQDSDKMQWLWLIAHSRVGSNIHAVGDDDQSIYGFRNAMGYLAFSGLVDEIGARQHFLSTNYRCGRDIVLVADQVISENVGRIPKQFKVGSSFPGQVLLSHYSDPALEAEAVILQFEELVDSGAIKPITNEFAVMHRTNFGLDYLDMAAVGCKYKVVRDGGSNFMDRPHVAQAHATLLLGLSPRDRLGWATAVEIAGMSNDGVNRFNDYIQHLSDKTDMEDALYDKGWLDRLGKQDRTLFQQYRSVLMEWRETISDLNESRAPDEDYEQPVIDVCEKLSMLTTKRNAKRDINFLGRTIASKLKGSLAARLKRVAQKEKPKEDEEGEAKSPVLRLMTLHSAKGLEFDACWVVGVNAGSLPMMDSDIEEERRLYYVGLTRAMVRIYISYIKSPDAQPSQFLDGLLKMATAA